MLVYWKSVQELRGIRRSGGWLKRCKVVGGVEGVAE